MITAHVGIYCGSEDEKTPKQYNNRTGRSLKLEYVRTGRYAKLIRSTNERFAQCQRETKATSKSNLATSTRNMIVT